MKTVTLEKHKNKDTHTYVGKASKNKYYGVKILSDVRVLTGFIIRENYDDGEHKLAACRSITNGNAWSHYNGSRLTKVLRRILEKGWLIQEFDSYQDLFAWLAFETAKDEQ